MARPRLTLISLLALAVLAACGSDDGSEPGTTGATGPPQGSTTRPETTLPPSTTGSPDTVPDTTVPATTAPSGEPEPAPEVITEAFDGAVLVMAVGEERPLQLDSTWAWETPVVDGPGVELTPVDYMLDPGYFEWLVTAVDPGAVRLTATGSPNCDDPAQCPPTEVTMTFHIDG